MAYSKENNQYVGKAFEQLLCDINTVNPYPSKITNNDFEVIKANAQIAKKYMPKGNYSWIGNHYTDKGDILQDDTFYWEVKYTQGTNGTWYNTSIYLLDKYNLNYKDFLNPLYTIFDNYNIPYLVKNNSPVSMKTSKYIRHSYPELAKLCKEKAAIINQQVCSALYTKLNSNTQLKQKFLNEMFFKSTKNGIADFSLVFNYKNQAVKIIDVSDITFSEQIYVQGQSIIFGDKLRVTFSWQNGAGLNNPTIRAFLI